MSIVDRLAARSGTVLDVALGAVLATALVVDAGTAGTRHGGWLFALTVGVVTSAAALLRRRSLQRSAAVAIVVCGTAELAAGVSDLPAQPGPAGALALLVLLGSAVRRLPVRAAAAVAAGGAAVTAGTLERYLDFITSGHQNAFTATRTMAAGWCAAVLLGLWLRLADGRRRAAVEAVRRGERLELARELHDTAAHHLTGLVVQAQAARVAARRRSETLDDTLAGIEVAGSEALTSMRKVIGLLRGPDDAGGTTDGISGGITPGPEPLADLVQRFAERVPGTRLQLPDGPPDPAWPPEVHATLTRIVQEALTNVACHAPDAREITVTLAHDPTGVTVQVTDDGPPGAPRFPHTGGYGLIGMRERVEALGGTLTAGPAARAASGRGAPSGWTVVATLPLLVRQ